MVKADAVNTPIGNMPTQDALDIDGLQLSASDKAMLLGVDIDGWLQELPDIESYYYQFGDRLPNKLKEQVEALKQRLIAEKKAVA